MNKLSTQHTHVRSWPVVLLYGYFILFPVSLLQSVFENSFLSALTYALKGAFIALGFLYVIAFRIKFTITILGALGFALSVALNAATLNKFSIDIWAIYILSFLFTNFTADEQKRLIRSCGILYLLTPFVLVAGTLSGVFKSDLWLSDEGLQISFGLINPNYFMFFFWYASLCWLLLRKFLMLLFTFIPTVLFYSVTETRSVLICGYYIIGMYAIAYMIRKYRAPFILRAMGFAIMFVINVALIIMLSGYSSILDEIALSDGNLLSRVLFLFETLDYLKANPDVFLFGGFEANLDNMYLNLIAALGIIHFVFLWILIQYALLRSILANQVERFIFISCVLLMGFIEHGIYSTIFPSVLLFVFITASQAVVLRDRSKERKMVFASS